MFFGPTNSRMFFQCSIKDLLFSVVMILERRIRFQLTRSRIVWQRTRATRVNCDSLLKKLRLSLWQLITIDSTIDSVILRTLLTKIKQHFGCFLQHSDTIGGHCIELLCILNLVPKKANRLKRLSMFGKEVVCYCQLIDCLRWGGVADHCHKATRH